jgi:NADPH-dependent ferric siderophore reductase
MWYQQWKALDNDDRNPVRTYTIRKAEPENGEMTVEFVSHSNPGPAGTFAQQCRIGDEVVIIGPDASSRHSDLGIDFRPGPSRHLLLMGDETAVPAISSILEHLHDSAWQGSGLALTEVPRKSDFRTLRMPSHFRMYQTATDGHKGASLLERLKTLAASGAAGFTPDRDQTGERIADVEDLSDADFLWEVPPQGPDDGLYAWVAGEASMVRSLRRFLVGNLGLDRHRIAFMGYYREGKREI